MSRDGNHRTLSAAGVVALRPGKRGFEVVLVHRPRYDDWSLPKGKPEHDEPLPATAVRELAEETGVQARLGLPLDLVSYDTDKGRKHVHFWLSRSFTVGHFVPDAEVDEVAWLPLDVAAEKLTYDDEGALLAQAATVPDTTPLVLVRHAKAMARKDWSGRDCTRPLTGRGRKQSERIVTLLAAYGVSRLVSSPATRCVQTLTPYAESIQRSIEQASLLTEEDGSEAYDEVSDLLETLRAETGASQTATAVCGHRPVLPAMHHGLDVPERPMHPGASVVVHVDSVGTTVGVEWHRPCA